MNANDLSAIVDRFRRLRIAVAGEAMLDSYLEGSTGRLCREAPVPVVSVSRRSDAPGGAGNTAANVAAMGASVRLCSIVGDDTEGTLLREALEAAGVGTADLITQAGRRTPAKHRVLADGQMLVRFDHGGEVEPTPSATEARFLTAVGRAFAECDAVIVSDYAGGLLSPRVLRALRDLQRRRPTLLVVDARDLAPYRGIRPTAVKPNFGEALRLLGREAPEACEGRADWVADRGEQVLELTGARIAAVTMDVEGALVFERGRPAYRTYAKPARNSRAAGAGDTFAAALALALAAGAHAPAAAELASAAAAVVVGKEGTACCSAVELAESVAGAGKYSADPARLAERLAAHRRDGRRIVFTNGCFDILHRGHITYLSRAKLLGDVLVVGVNSDAGVRRLKGAGRPVNPAEDRVQVLAALSCVDHIALFDSDTAEGLIRRLRPDVYVKGGDYAGRAPPEAALVESLGGRVEILPLVEDRSTTGIIERIRGHRTNGGPAGVRNGSTRHGRADHDRVREVGRGAKRTVRAPGHAR